MVLKKFPIDTRTWDELRFIKNHLSDRLDTSVAWNKTFRHILRYYRKGGGFSSKTGLLTKESSNLSAHASTASISSHLKTDQVPTTSTPQSIITHAPEGGVGNNINNSAVKYPQTKQAPVLPTQSLPLPSSIHPPKIGDLSKPKVSKIKIPPSKISAPVISLSLNGTQFPSPSPLSVPDDKISGHEYGAGGDTKTPSFEDLGIPKVPMKDPIHLKVSKDLLRMVKEKETSTTKYILIECRLCGDVPIVMPIPKQLIENAKLPVVDISYVHGDPKHVIVAQVDHDYKVRRRRTSWVVFEE